MATPDQYKLQVTYQYADEYIPFMQIVAEKDHEAFCKCVQCGIPYITSLYYKDTQLCTWCSGHCPTKDEVKHEKHLDYMRKRARERKDEVSCLTR